MFLVVGVASVASGLLWIVVALLVVRFEDRTLTRVSRILSAIAFVGVDAVLAYAYVIHGDADIIRFTAVFVQAFKIVAALAAIIALKFEVKQREEASQTSMVRRYRHIGRRPRQRPLSGGTHDATPPPTTHDDEGRA